MSQRIIIASTYAEGERHARACGLGRRDYVILTPRGHHACRGRRFTDADSFDVLPLPGFTTDERERFLCALIPCGPPADVLARVEVEL